MKHYSLNIKPFGKNAILLEWPQIVSEDILDDILAFKEAFKNNVPTADNWELVPAYSSLTLISVSEELNFKSVRSVIEETYLKRELGVKPKRFLWKLPVCYDLEFGIDLEEVSEILNLDRISLIQEHTSRPYTVFGIGFLPGFMYLGGLPEKLEVRRRLSPRAKVLKGSVGLAGKQTGIYPQDSPGGWNIIGNCPISIFNAEREEPCFVNVGDKIEFYSISKAEYDLHKIEAEVGIFKPNKVVLND